MPNVNNMGIGKLGAEGAIFKRKNRWAFQILTTGDARAIVSGATLGDISDPEMHFCKISSRPNFSFDEQEVQHVSEKVFLPAKPQWEPISITVYDLKENSAIYRWLIQFYNPIDGVINPVAQESISGTFPKKISELTMLDGHGNEIEKWEFQGCWPQTINWGELDFSSSDTADVEFTMRYDRAVNRTVQS